MGVRSSSRVPGEAELEERLDGAHEPVPLLLCQHVLLHVHLHLIRIVVRRIRGPDVTNKQAVCALELARHFVSEKLVAQLHARIGPDGKAGGVDANETVSGKGVNEVVHVRAWRSAGIHNQAAEVAVHVEELHLGQQQLALPPVNDCLGFVAAPMVSQCSAGRQQLP